MIFRSNGTRKRIKLILKNTGSGIQEAEQVFDDDYMLYEQDIKHSSNEERFKALGMSRIPRLLMVVHCMREGLKVRIISARKATKSEEVQYESRRRI